MSTFIPSPQQAAVLQFVQYGRGSAIIEAVAGAGKTTTLVEVCKLIAQQPRTSAVFTAFNKKIADEIGSRLQAASIDWRQVRSATFHSMGFSAWRKAAPGVVVNEDKVVEILKRNNVPAEYWSFVCSAVSLSKQWCVGVLWDPKDTTRWFSLADHYDLADKLENVDGAGVMEHAIGLAQSTLLESVNTNQQVVDFDDMLFAPLVHNVRFWQHDYVLVDEAQDTNPARRMLARRMLKPTGRLLAVGDPHQAIYGFTGADNDSLDIIAQEFGAVRLPLTVTYRCPRTVVQFARQWVSHITAHETAPNGSVRTMSEGAFAKLDEAVLNSNGAILCRNTAPLVETAFALIRRRIPCHIAGRDIGEGLIKLATKWKQVLTVADLRDKLGDHVDHETERLAAKQNQESKLATLLDKVATLHVFMEACKDDDAVGVLVGEIAKVFADAPAPGITLSTIHKAKGLEWERVFWLGRNRWQPSPFARQQWQVEQEVNLMYVAATRAKCELIEVEVSNNPKQPKRS